MNMVCPSGSYDANIEPAKDDVLFTDAQFILELVELFFQEVYGDIKLAESTTLSSKRPTSKSDQTFDFLLARKQPALQGTPTRTNNGEPETPSQRDGILGLQAGFEDESPRTVHGTPSNEFPTDPTTFSESGTPLDELDNNERPSASTWKGNMYTGT